MTLAEHRDGALTARAESKRRQLTDWIDNEVVPFFDDRTIPLTVNILIDWLRTSRQFRTSRKTRDAADLLIAATARVHNLVLVSRNVRDFAGTGIVVYDPWNDKVHSSDPG